MLHTLAGQPERGGGCRQTGRLQRSNPVIVAQRILQRTLWGARAPEVPLREIWSRTQEPAARGYVAEGIPSQNLEL